MKKKFKYWLIVPLFLAGAGANAQTWKWAKDISSTSSIESKGIATDNNRNNFIVTNFAGTATYGSTNLTSAGSTDVALSKLDEDGNYLWTVPVVTGTGGDLGVAVTCDPTGSDIFVTGQFYGTAIFGGTTSLTSAGNADVFIAKFNSAGTLVWAVKAGGSSYDECEDIAWARCPGICRGTYVFITGQFTGTATFGTNSITSASSNAMFTTMYNGNTGANVWVKQASTIYNSVYSTSITADASDNVYVTGSFYWTATFGSLSLSSSDYNQFVLKYNSAGTEQWVKQGGGTSIESGEDLRVDASGNVYVVGESASSWATYGSFSISGAGGYDIVVVKYNSSGTEQWATSAGGSLSDHPTGMALDNAGCPYITGYFESSTISFGPINLTADASQDPFIARINSSGVFNKAVSPVGSPSYAVGIPDDIAFNALGNAVITGNYQYSFTFGSTTINTGGPQHVFAARLDPGDWPIVEGSIETIVNSDVDAAGNTYVCGYSGTQNAFVEKINAAGASQWMYNGYNGCYFCAVEADAVTCDASGNVYLSGRHNGSATFGTTTLAPGASNAAYIVKYNSSGTQQWALRSAEGLSGNVLVEDMTTDASGNVYVAGEFYSSAKFGTGTGAITLTSGTSASNAYIAKYDSNGNILMAVNACAAPSGSTATGIALSGSDIYLSGHFLGTNVPFGSGSFLSSSAGSTDMFVAKYNSSGVGTGVVTGGGTSADYMFDVATFGGYIYATGSFQGSGSFGGVSIATTYGWDAFLVKINPITMNVMWTRQVNNPYSTSGVPKISHGRRVDASGSGVYITGEFDDSPGYSTTFGDGTTNVYLTSAGGFDAYVEKFDQNGVYQWVKQLGGANDETPRGLGLDGSDYAYVASNFVAPTSIDGANYSSGTYFVEKLAYNNGTFARQQEIVAEAGLPAIITQPNPFTDYTEFNIPDTYTGEYILSVYDISGREVIRQSGIIDRKIILQRQGLEAGIYSYILLFNQSSAVTGKLIAQ